MTIFSFLTINLPTKEDIHSTHSSKLDIGTPGEEETEQ